MTKPLLKILHRIFGQGLDANTKRFALSGSLGNAWVQLLSMGLVFATQIFIARIGGDEAYGTYSQVFNWITVLFIVAAFGSDLLLVKQIPIYQGQGDGRGIRSVYVWTNLMVALSSLTVVGGFALAVNYGNIPGLSNNAHYFNISLPGIMLGALMVPQQAYLRGIRKVVWGQTSEKLVKPLGLILALSAFWYLGKTGDIESYVWANVFAFGLACGYALTLILPYRTPLRGGSGLRFDWPDWTRRSLQFTVAGLLFMLSTRLDVLAVGSLMDDGNSQNIYTGYYNAALKFADLTIFPYFIISHSIAPLYSRFHTEGRMDELQALFRNATRVIFVLTFGVFLFFLLFGKWVLGLFGEVYQVGYWALVLLSLGKLVSSLVGPVGMMMMMTGHEKFINVGLFLQIIIAGLCLWFFIPSWGLVGAAAASVAGMVFFKTFVAIVLWRKSGLKATIF
jgi:O-antigen/teichoic acid export membrane protein